MTFCLSPADRSEDLAGSLGNGSRVVRYCEVSELGSQ
jgi:hypothetical protein